MYIETDETDKSNTIFQEIQQIGLSKNMSIQEEVNALTCLVAACGKLSFRPSERIFIIYIPPKVFGRPKCRAMEVTFFLQDSNLLVKLHGKHNGSITTWPEIRNEVGGIAQALELIQQHDGGRIAGNIYPRTEALNKVYSKIAPPESPPIPPTEAELVEKLRVLELELTEFKSMLAKVKTGVNRIGRRLGKVKRLGPMSEEEIAAEYRSLRAAFKSDAEYDDMVEVPATIP